MNRVKLALEGVKNCITQWEDILPEKILNMSEEIDNQLIRIDLEEKLQIKIGDYHRPITGYVDLSGTHKVSLTLFSDENGKEISWPDDGQQPIPGWYLRFCFPTGAYMFDGEYPEKSFDKFFNVLKNYGAHYCDTMNKGLYFSLDRDIERARQVYKDYTGIYNEHYEMAKREVLGNKIAQIENELAKLKEQE